MPMKKAFICGLILGIFLAYLFFSKWHPIVRVAYREGDRLIVLYNYNPLNFFYSSRLDLKITNWKDFANEVYQ